MALIHLILNAFCYNCRIITVEVQILASNKEFPDRNEMKIRRVQAGK